MKPCGTEAAYRRHLRRAESVCEACQRSHAEYVRGRKASIALADGIVLGVGSGTRSVDVSEAIDEIAAVLHGC